MPPTNFHATLTDGVSIRCDWSAITTDIELLNGWQVSGYALKISEHSTPSVSIPSEGPTDIDAAVLTHTFGPLESGREYRVSIAGKVKSRPGVFAHLCIRTAETGQLYPSYFSKFVAFQWNSTHADKLSQALR